MGISCV